MQNKTTMNIHKHTCYAWLLLCFLLTQTASLSAQTITVDPIDVPTGKYEFTATGLDNTAFPNLSGTEFRFFWHFGDGQYMEYLEDVPAGGSTTVAHQYKTRGPHVAYLEVTPAYDDDDPPTVSSFVNTGDFDPSCNCTPITAASLPNHMGNAEFGFNVTTNRNLVKDQSITYILNYSNVCYEDVATKLNGVLDGTITFDYSSAPLLSEQATPLSIKANRDQSSGVPPQTYKWDFQNLQPGELRNIFVRMEVAPTAQLGESIAPVISFQITKVDGVVVPSGQATCPESTTITLAKKVDNSHDPNDLRSNEVYLCPDELEGTVRYTIRFRNDGSRYADKVIIKDVIPDVFRISSINPIYPSNLQGYKLQPQINSTNREVRWDIINDYLRLGKKLRGTKEADFLSHFGPEATVDSLVFEIDYLDEFVKYDCDAIINQAEIIFDCNPSFYTNPDIYLVGCLPSNSSGGGSGGGNNNGNNSGNGNNSTANFSAMPLTLINCDSCAGDTIVYLPPITHTGTPVQLTYSTNLINGFNNLTKFRWYPSEGLSIPGFSESPHLKPNPFADPIKGTTYFLVASNKEDDDGPCRRTILAIPVEKNCNLQIIPKIHCTSNQLDSITATVSGNYGVLRWQDCSYGNTFSYDISNLAQKKFLLSVVDTITNCSTYIYVPLQCPPDGPYLPKTIIGILIVGIIAYALLNYFFGGP